MKWWLLVWIIGCSGEDCQIPEYEYKQYETEELCWAALIDVKERPHYTGVCVALRWLPDEPTR